MAQSLATPLPTTSTPISTKLSKKSCIPSVCFPRIWASHDQRSKQVLDVNRCVRRRNVALGLAGAVLGLNTIRRGDGSANAAGRRPPPPPAEEKKDPNVSGVQAKVLASRKRKEAMKQAVAQLREKGKPVKDQPSE